MSLDLNNFMHSLAVYMAAGAAVSYITVPRGLWRNAAEESAAADPYSVLRITGGPGTKWQPVPIIAIQCDTRGKSSQAALAQAQKLLETLLDSDGRPLQMTTINGFKASDGLADGTWRLMGVSVISRPGIVGVDERGGTMCFWNVEVAVTKLT